MVELARARPAVHDERAEQRGHRAAHGPVSPDHARIRPDEARVARNVDQCWVWRNVVVADTDAEAARIAIPAFNAMQEHRAAMRNRIYTEQGLRSGSRPQAAPATRTGGALARLRLAGDGGGGWPSGGNRRRRLIMQFRLGPMSHDDTAQSLTLFKEKVMPELD